MINLQIPLEFLILFVVVLILIILVIAVRYYMFPNLDIVGNSMYPTLLDGEKKHSRRFFNKFDTPKIGRIYVYRDPTGKLVIKRLKMIKDDLCYFVGDNPSMSYDSRYYGFINRKHIVALLME
jgi:signal peptidase I